ncbi:MAG: glutathione S-transferase [Parasphingorhabdus sp.]
MIANGELGLNSSPKLISFELCPFVQRSAIVMLERGIKFDIEYIDLANPPDWFLDLSPNKKVPLLLVEGQMLFDSVAINEYLEDAWPGGLHPANLIQRARHRAWIEFSNGCMWAAFHLSVKPTAEEFATVLADLHAQFDYLECHTIANPFFGGERFSLVDASFAPLFQRLIYLDTLKPGVLDYKRHPAIVRWIFNLIDIDTVQASCVQNLACLYQEMLWKRQGYISQFLDEKFKQTIAEKSIY